mmetsp:Transcript_14108/g.48634  ORF Transcript_14108/g.48634 Transcript_14108/m.48634 type:complete len:315 (-) Transcript_14108:468-1412(-)
MEAVSWWVVRDRRDQHHALRGDDRRRRERAEAVPAGAPGAAHQAAQGAARRPHPGAYRVEVRGELRLADAVEVPVVRAVQRTPHRVCIPPLRHLRGQGAQLDHRVLPGVHRRRLRVRAQRHGVRHGVLLGYHDNDHHRLRRCHARHGRRTGRRHLRHAGGHLHLRVHLWQHMQHPGRPGRQAPRVLRPDGPPQRVPEAPGSARGDEGCAAHLLPVPLREPGHSRDEAAAAAHEPAAEGGRSRPDQQPVDLQGAALPGGGPRVRVAAIAGAGERGVSPAGAGHQEGRAPSAHVHHRERADRLPEQGAELGGLRRR